MGNMATLADPVQLRVVPPWAKLVTARSTLVAAVSLAYGVALALDGLTLLTGPPHASDHVTGPLLLLSPWFFLLGTLLFLRASPRRVGSAAYLLFASAACALALAPGADDDQPLAVAAELVAVPLFAAAFAYFFLTFPTPRRVPHQRLLLLAPALASVALGVAARAWPPLAAPAFLLRLVIQLVYLGAGVALLAHVWAAACDRDEHRGLGVIGVGTVASILPFVALYLLPALLGQRAPVGAEQATLALAILPASFTYAILRYHALHAPLLQRWLVRGLLRAGLLTLYVTTIWALQPPLAAALPAADRGLAVAVAPVLLAGILFLWLRVGLERILDRLFFKDAYDYRAALQGLSRDLSLASNSGVPDVSFAHALRALMNLDFALLLVRDPQGVLSVRDADGEGAADDGGDQPAVLPELVASASGTQEGPRVSSIVSPMHGGPAEVELVPLCTHGEVVGYLCLGPKGHAEPFRATDHDLLATLGGHLAAVVRNEQLVADLCGQVGVLRAQKAALDALNERLHRAQEEERARIAADIHDEPLQTAQHLQRQLTADGRRDAPTGCHVALADTLIAQLRAVCAKVRPAALDELGLAAALETLTLDLGTHVGVQIVLDADPELTELAIAPDVELVLYRAAQEAVNNVLRHARPHHLRVTLQRHGDTVRLRVADDGVGFVAPAHLDGLVAAGHVGLAGLRQRVQRAGGHVSIETAPAQGTVVQVEFSITPTGEAATGEAGR